MLSRHIGLYCGLAQAAVRSPVSLLSVMCVFSLLGPDGPSKGFSVWLVFSEDRVLVSFFPLVSLFSVSVYFHSSRHILPSACFVVSLRFFFPRS